MSSRRRRGLKAWLLIITTGLGVGLLAPAQTLAHAEESGLAATRVVFVGIPGLLWGDLDSGLTPELAALAERGALGDMTVRAARSRTCILDGWATMGAGNRARYPAPTEVVDENLPQLTPEEEVQRALLAGCGQQEQVALAGLTDVTQTVSRIAEDEGTRLFGAEPGALGQAVSCSTAIGRASAVAVSAPGAQVSIIDDLPSGSPQLSAAFSRCPLTLVSLPALIGSVPSVALDREPVNDDGVGSSGPGQLAELRGRPREQALAALDAAVGRVSAAAAALPGETLLLVAGLSEKGLSRAQLHPLIAVHPDLPPGYLTSSSTGRAPYVQLIDVAPTVLRSLGVPDPASMAGSAIRWAGRSGDIDDAFAELRDLNRVAVAHSGLTRTYFWTLVALTAGLVAGLVRTRKGKRGWTDPAGRAPHRMLSLAALALAVLPASTHLANLTPWWRSPTRELALGLAVVGWVVLLVALALALGGRRGPVTRLLPPQRRWTAPAVVVLVVTAVTIGLDVVLGSPMELNSLLGYNPIVAGRFVGLGNLSFGMFAVSILLATSVFVRGSPRRRVVGIGAVGLVAVVIVGAAGLGRDFGGVLALVPGFIILAMLVTGTRMSARRVMLIAAVTAVVVSAFAILDYQRQPDDRTHLGRFVAQILDGQAWTVIARKAQANLDVLTSSPVTWLIPIFAVAAWVMLRQDTRLRTLLARDLAWKAGTAAALSSVAIGALINDSGIAVPAIAGCVVVPAFIWLTLSAGPANAVAAAEGATDTPTGDWAPSMARVSVSSREPTG